MGLKSIDEKFVHTYNYKIIQYFLQNKSNTVTLKQLMDILKIKYHNDHDVGSNLHNQVVDAISIYYVILRFWLMSEIAIVEILLKCFIFVTSVDKISSFRLKKRINIRFDKNVSLPQASTCSKLLG